MDFNNESFIKQSLLDNQQKHSTKKYPKIIFISILVLLLLMITTSMIFSSIYKKKLKPIVVDAYLSSSSRYYCHLTMYPELCYDSISSIINTTALKSNPSAIFSSSIRVSINELNNTTISISKAMSTYKTNNSLVGLKLSKCRTWVHKSLSLLNESLSTMGVDFDIEWLTYEEMDNMKAWTVAAMDDAFKCFLGLDEIDNVMMVEGDEENVGVEEVKSGVEKARNCMINSIGLLDGRETILSDFYNPFIEDDDYYSVPYLDFDYKFFVCFYFVVYLFLALLYLLFWRSG